MSRLRMDVNVLPEITCPLCHAPRHSHEELADVTWRCDVCTQLWNSSRLAAHRGYIAYCLEKGLAR